MGFHTDHTFNVYESIRDVINFCPGMWVFLEDLRKSSDLFTCTIWALTKNNLIF